MGDSRRNADTPYFQAFLETFFALSYICIAHENLQATGKLQTSKTDVCPLSRVNTNTPRQRMQNDNFVISLKSTHFAYLCVRNRTIPPQNTNIFLKYLQPVYISFTFIYYYITYSFRLIYYYCILFFFLLYFHLCGLFVLFFLFRVSFSFVLCSYVKNAFYPYFFCYKFCGYK